MKAGLSRIGSLGGLLVAGFVVARVSLGALPFWVTALGVLGEMAICGRLSGCVPGSHGGARARVKSRSHAAKAGSRARSESQRFGLHRNNRTPPRPAQRALRPPAAPLPTERYSLQRKVICPRLAGKASLPPPNASVSASP